MIGRPSVAAALAVALLAALTVTAFAVTLPAVSGPQARDLPRIVSEATVAPVATASPTGAVEPSQSNTNTPAPSSSGSSGSTGPRPSNPSAPDASTPARDHHAASADHEVVEPRLHESDDESQTKPQSDPSRSTTRSSGSGLASLPGSARTLHDARGMKH